MKDIILTGPKHSGKTSAGKILASLCSSTFVDLDEFIIERTGKTPRELYTESPVDFQKAEAEAITAILESNNGDPGRKRHIIATSGGIIDNQEAAATLKNSDAMIVSLNVSAECAWSRITAAGELPPFLQTENPKETHYALHLRRTDAYHKLTSFVIEAEGKTPEEIAIEIWGRC